MKRKTYNQTIIDEAKNENKIIKSIKIPLISEIQKRTFQEFIGDSFGNNYGYIYYLTKN